MPGLVSGCRRCAGDPAQSKPRTVQRDIEERHPRPRDSSSRLLEWEMFGNATIEASRGGRMRAAPDAPTSPAQALVQNRRRDRRKECIMSTWAEPAVMFLHGARHLNSSSAGGVVEPGMCRRCTASTPPSTFLPTALSWTPRHCWRGGNIEERLHE